MLTISDIVLSFGGNKALDGVSFSVAPGETLALIGPNGAGKSTVFNVISRYYRPSTGSVRYGEHDLLQRQAHEIASLGIARTFQNIELFENATVLQNLLVGRHARTPSNWGREFLFAGATRANELIARRKVEEVLDLLDLQHLRNEVVRDLAYGARKNVELARAVCAEPQLLLLDEPASGLNPEEVADMAFWLKDIREELGITILMVEHNMNLVARLATRCIALVSGRVLAQGSVAEVQSNREVQRAYLGTAA
ncbi:ABC transporter ATP-binding protein [Ferrovibrio sp.]|uniref:ABC transporter ATP-binding protein n=1 Tax=Ferrovibrio sp. TaxID=1917215 RepID=UPI003D0CFDAF